MNSKHDKKVFDQIWQQKALSDDLNSSYIPGKNLRIDYCIRNLPKGAKFLDIGCGTGILANEVKGKYSEVFGVDIAELPVKIACANGINASVCNLNFEKLPFPDDFFDSLTLLSTLQYFHDLDFSISEIRRVLRPSGYLLLSIPNVRSYWRVFKLAIIGKFPQVSKDKIGYDGGTLHYFCYQDLKKILLDNGFNILKKRWNFL